MSELLSSSIDSEVKKDSHTYILLVGPPNVGKSALFNKLSGKYLANVSNYPGTTIEVTKTKIDLQTKEFLLMDTPGINSLLPLSEDEAITLRTMVYKKVDHILLVGDSKNLQKAINLVVQVSLLGFPIIFILNMADELTKKGISIDTSLLSKLLGIPVFLTIAIENRGVGEIFSAEPSVSLAKPEFPEYIKEITKKIQEQLPKQFELNKEGLSIQLLRDDPVVWEWFRRNSSKESQKEIKNIISDLNSKYHLGMNYIIATTINNFARKISGQVIKHAVVRRPKKKWSIDNLTINPITGFPILLLVMLVIFLLVGYIGAGFLVDFIENEIFNNMINPFIINIVNSFFQNGFINEFLIGKFGLITLGLTYALGVILPIVAIFFLIFSFLEDTGYLPRIAVLLNSSFNRIGLNGKAVLPILLGTGCVTMATLSTRILESRKERLIATTVLAIGIPCSAQLAVILGLATFISLPAFFLIFAVVISQILLVSYLMSKIIPGKRSEFLIELPPIRKPQISNVILKTFSRIESFLREAVPIFILGIFFINILNVIGMIDLIITGFEPIVVLLLGLPKDTSLTFIFGFIRRDFGAAGLFELVQAGLLTTNQIVIVSVVLILFIPCIANFFMIIKENGLKIALSILLFVIPYAILVGTIINFSLIIFGVNLT